MSKRYGRNQKRKAAEKIQSLEDNATKLHRDLDFTKHITSTCRNIVEILRRVNPHSAVLKAAEVTDERWRYTAFLGESMVDVAAMGEPPQYVDIRHIDLYELEAELVRSVEFRDAVHVRVAFRNPHSNLVSYSYRASLEGLKLRGAKGIANEIAHKLTDALRATHSSEYPRSRLG